MTWTEKEVKAAVAAYFKLLKAEQAGRQTNKAALYRALASKFPERGPKAFELKFQNISAILYEHHLPYCTGLRPRGNFQRLLKLLVLDHLDRSPLPAVEPHEILFARLRKLGPITVTEKGSGRFGLAVEGALGIQQNSSKAPDFMGIELKTKRDQTLQTLFSRVPSRYTQDQDKRGMFDRHCYDDWKRNRRALYTSFTSQPNSLGFSLIVERQIVRVVRNGDSVLEYDAETLEEALLSKHSQTVFLAVAPMAQDGKEFCTLTAATYCKPPSVIRFMRLISEGEVYLDFTMSARPNGRIADHGFLWRIRGESIDRLYLSTEVLNLNAT